MKLYKDPIYRASFEHARALTEIHAKSFYASARLLPAERRWATYALYGFCRYADNLIDIPRNRSQRELIEEAGELARELRRAYTKGESEHPIVKPFVATALQFDIPLDYPLDLIEGVKMDLSVNRYQTFDDLYVFAYRVAGVVGLMMTHIMGYSSELAFPYAEKLGIAMQLTNILRDVQEDKEMNRIYLPQEEMEAYGVTEADIMAERDSDGLRQLIKAQVDRAHDIYVDAHPGIGMLASESQFAIYAASKLYRGILHKIEAREYNPFQGRVFVPGRNKLSVLVKELVRTRFLPQNDPELVPLPIKEYVLDPAKR